MIVRGEACTVYFILADLQFHKLNGPLEPGVASWGLTQPDSIGKKRVTLILFIQLLVIVKYSQA